jgi:hypothetical protein
MALLDALECDYIARVAYDRAMRARPRVPGPVDRLSFMPSADGSLVLNRGPLLFSREVFALDAAPHIVGNN